MDSHYINWSDQLGLFNNGRPVLDPMTVIAEALFEKPWQDLVATEWVNKRVKVYRKGQLCPLTGVAFGTYEEDGEWYLTLTQNTPSSRWEHDERFNRIEHVELHETQPTKDDHSWWGEKRPA